MTEAQISSQRRDLLAELAELPDGFSQRAPSRKKEREGGAYRPGVRFTLPVWDERKAKAGKRKVTCVILSVRGHFHGDWQYIAEAPEPVAVRRADGGLVRSSDIFPETPREQFLIFENDLTNNTRLP